MKFTSSITETDRTRHGELHNLLSDIEDLIKNQTSWTEEDLSHAKVALGERIDSAKKSMDEMGKEITERTRYAVKTTDNYVHENPWQAIGIGAALGILVGVVVSRR
jgi:ElaB/YqjD/DUF883 family membrane-anchored ribosome-binding protein